MSHRPPWSSLPPLVTGWVEQLLGAPVTLAQGQASGFSPASADRVVAANGSRAFVKAVHESANRHTPDMHRAEARVARSLPEGFPSPRLLGSLDADGWVALAFEDVDGHHPGQPWRTAELDAVLATLAEVARLGTPCPVDGLGELPEIFGEDFAGWVRVAADPPTDLDPWLAARLGELRDRAAAGTAALRGSTLAHVDVRDDNLLLDAAGRVWVLDWPWACRGAAWADALLLLFAAVDDTNLPQIDARIDALLDGYGVPAAVGTDVLSAFVSFFVDAARRPGPPGQGDVQAHRQRRVAYVVPLLRHRLGD